MISATGYRLRLRRDAEALHHGAFVVLGLAAAAAAVGLAVSWLVVGLAAGAFALYAWAWRAGIRQRRLVNRAGVVYGAAAAAERVASTEELAGELLRTARDLLQADGGWIAFLSRTPRGTPMVARLADGRVLEPEVRRLTPVEQVVSSLATLESGPVLIDATRADAPTREALRALDLHSTLVSTFGVDGGVRGVLVLGRAATARRFGSEELTLVDAFAEHLRVLVENDRLERSLREVTGLKEQLRHQAFHDALTGLPNRVLFAERVAGDLANAVAGLTAVLFLDLDDFKTINDSLGHQAGDELLVAAAQRVAVATRSTDTAARLGGDEFAVLARVHRLEEAVELAERLVSTLEAPFTIGGREMSVHASVGIAVGEPGSLTADELLRNADAAMYEAKRGGKRRYAQYEKHLHVGAQKRQELATALDRAVAREEIGVHYQPIVELETGQILGVEALARWERPNAGLAYPASFLPLAEEIGLMIDIGRLVLAEAARDASSWRSSFAGREELRVSVNLAPSELHNPDLVSDVAATLDRHGLDPRSLVLELTESGVMRSPQQAREKMVELRALGISLALDDFGTGHSSLAHLREFPLDSLKIAREFVAGLPDGHVDHVFVETIVRMGNALGLEVVAEGIETEAQARAVAELGCRFGQGYYFGQPVGVFGVTHYLAASRLPHAPALRLAGAA